MKKLLIIILIILLRISCYAQDLIFNGVYKGASNGVSYTLYLTNNDGVVSGTIRNTERATIESVITASVTNINYLKGIQKEKRNKKQFIAIEEKGEIIWEIRNGFFGRLFRNRTKIIKYTKIEANIIESNGNSGSNQKGSVNN